MLSAVFLLLSQSSGIDRDAYGVPVIRATSVESAWRLAGRAVAEDRLWQMELSRRLARGRLAEVLGPKYVSSDKEVLLSGYTDEELDQQFAKLSPKLKQMTTAYVAGVNDAIAERKELPEGYLKNGFKPEPWEVRDTVAIAVRLLQLFGRGGAGEIRNMAMLSYLQAREPLKGKALDVLDDLAWQNDPKSPVTVDPADEARTPKPIVFPSWDRKTTLAHIARLPKLGLFDLLPGLSLENRDTSRLIAQNLNLPYKTGSYCMVVGKGRSSSGLPVLLSGPQMGFQTPSVVHEISVHAPGLDVAGMDVPGMPGVLIGATPNLAWGLTSGVADTDDIVFYARSDDDKYRRGADWLALQNIPRLISVKGSRPVTVNVTRTIDGPVIIDSSGSKAVFARRSSHWGRELESLEAVVGLYNAKTPEQVTDALQPATMSFNFFFATRDGEIGYRYMGLVPVRAGGLDYRFPVPGDPQYDWKGMVPYESMPHVINPRSGLITNWNNKPAVWWPNGDTPVWGEIFHVSNIRSCLTHNKLGASDLELAAWSIARQSDTYAAFAPYLAESGLGMSAWMMDGSYSASSYQEFLDNLRRQLFLKPVGSLISPDYFRMALQPTLMLQALRGKTKYDYLAGRTVAEIIKASLPKGFDSRYSAPTISVPGEVGIPYSNRGTYIQVIEATPSGMAGRNVLPPGVDEAGPHSRDQVPLSRAWIYKPMVIR